MTKTKHLNMDIEQKDIDLNNEGTETVETHEEETVETPAEEHKEVKPSETPEARLARLERQASQLRKKLGVSEPEKPSKSSNDLDYGQKAYLAANGVKGSKEMDFVKQELKSSGLSLEALLENDYFQAKLEKQRALNKTAEATPTGKRSGGVPLDSVDYWMTKPLEEVPRDMRGKVVDAMLAKEKSKGVFYNS